MLTVIQALIDTSSLIHAWDNYPIKQFKPFWLWMEKQFLEKDVATIPEVIGEIKTSPEFLGWVKPKIHQIEISQDMLSKQEQIEKQLEITNGNYSTQGGVNGVDILLIAAASNVNCSLIANEGKQETPPAKKLNYKIPLVCRTIIRPKIPTYSFIGWLKYKDPTF